MIEYYRFFITDLITCPVKTYCFESLYTGKQMGDNLSSLVDLDGLVNLPVVLWRSQIEIMSIYPGFHYVNLPYLELFAEFLFANLGEICKKSSNFFRKQS